MRRTPLILWTAILLELWRLILMTAAILVVVLAFAGAIRFLADGKIGPATTIRWMFLTMPAMLQYALPFAAGFGATLAYHRIVTDNELTASHAAGVSHRSILFPAVLSGAILSLTLLVLSNLIIPRFLLLAEKLITRDAARFIVNSIERKEAVQMENILLYADLVRRSPDTGNADHERLYLKGVFVVELDKHGHLKHQLSAREADVWLVRAPAAPGAAIEDTGDTVTHVVIRSRGTVGQKSSSGESGRETGAIVEGETLSLARTIPNAFSDDPKYLSWGDLRELRRDPSRINTIDSRRRILAARLAERATTSAIARSLAETGMVRFDAGEGASVTVYGSNIHWDLSAKHWVVTDTSGADDQPATPKPLVVHRQYETGRITRQFADSVVFQSQLDPASPDREVTVELTLAGLTADQAAAGAPQGAVRRTQTVAMLTVPQANVESIMAADTPKVLAAADALVATDPNPFVATPRDDLRKQVADLMWEITSKQHERFASAAACLVMTVTGAIMAIRLRNKLPLEVYLWAFFPALATIITISAGQQMIHAKGAAGIPLMWSGVLLLGAYTFLQFRHVARR